METKITKHSPAPWKIRINYPERVINGNRTIAECCDRVNSPSNEDLANAKLIAAAPELLEAVKIGLTYVKCSCSSNEERLNKHIEILEKAIAKAEGRD